MGTKPTGTWVLLLLRRLNFWGKVPNNFFRKNKQPIPLTGQAAYFWSGGHLRDDSGHRLLLSRFPASPDCQSLRHKTRTSSSPSSHGLEACSGPLPGILRSRQTPVDIKPQRSATSASHHTFSNILLIAGLGKFVILLLVRPSRSFSPVLIIRGPSAVLGRVGSKTRVRPACFRH